MSDSKSSAGVAISTRHLHTQGLSHLPPKWTFVDRLRKARENANLGQAELGDLLAKKRSTISNWERGANRPDELALRAIAHFTGVPLVWLQHGEPSGHGDDSPGLGISPSACYSRQAGRVVSLLTDVFPLAA